MKKIRVMVFSGIHQAICNACLPIIFSSMIQIKGCIDFEMSPFSYVAPSMILLGFMVYPIFTYHYMRRNIRLLHDQHFLDCHYAMMCQTSYKGLWWVIPLHYRRITYCFVLVFMSHLQGI